MVKRIRVAVVAALGVATLVAGPVTTASAGTTKADPAVTDVSVTPNPVEVKGAETVKVTFTAETSGDASAVTGWIKPSLGVETEFRLARSDDLGSGKARWKYTKDVNRQFAAGKWTFRAVTANTAPKSADFTVKQVFETDFDDIAATPSTVDEGGRITLSGVLRQNGANGWAPLANARVHLAFRPLGGSYDRLPGSVETNGQGRFWLRAKAFRTGHWRAEYDGSSTTLGARSETDRVDVRGAVRHSRIVDFGAGPDPVDQGDRIGVGGRLQVDTGHGWQGHRGRKVFILFRADGESRWNDVATDRTDAQGRFGVDVTATRSGDWRAEFDGADGVEGASSVADHVTVRKPAPEPERGDSRITRFNASPEPGRYGRYLRFGGTLQVRDDDGWEGYGAKVGLYFKPKGSHKWQYVKTVRAAESGRVLTRARTYGSGYWKFVFKGDDDFYGDSSASDYVRVVRR
ncbi:hypothetical protein [Streptosporangium carneum]|uniref:Htaa domain-containing protein n=1 Tax=Streptosporangium carneum TaxID=47481 RepID=A0A9W6IA48_9ACTN|nr:hypothetical protein [Streptosporangium carneum]GLK14241.1 hypothetical protein GCM10017600_76530 [Streptosporangium carneum]